VEKSKSQGSRKKPDTSSRLNPRECHPREERGKRNSLVEEDVSTRIKGKNPEAKLARIHIMKSGAGLSAERKREFKEEKKTRQN